jgi:hypothetical protein
VTLVLIGVVMAVGAVGAAPAGAAPGDEVWAKIWAPSGGTVLDSPLHMSIGPRGEIFVVGTMTKEATTRAFLARYTSAGRRVWLRYWTKGTPTVVAMAVDETGNVVLMGEGGDPDRDWVVGKYSRTGTHLWTKMSPTAYDDAAFDVTVDPYGGIYLACGEWRAAVSSTVIKLGPTGKRLWTRRHYQVYGSIADRIAWGGGGLYVASEDYLPGGMMGPSVLKYSRTGDQLWGRWLTDPVLDSLVVKQLAVSAAGVVVTGYDQNGQWPGFVLKLAHDGTIRYASTYSVFNPTIFADCAIDAAGNCYVGGPVRMSAGGVQDFAVLRFAAADNSQTVTMWWTGQSGTNAGVTALALASDGAPYATGYRTFVPGGVAMWTGTGPDALTWGKSWTPDFGVDTRGTGIAVRGTAVYAVGRTEDGEMALVKYAR